MTCSDCHNPHSGKLRAEGNAMCATCHLPAKYDTPAHHHHQVASAGATCVGCHMPATTYMVIDPRRDHSLRIPRPDLAVTLGTPNACTSCHTTRDARWAAERAAAWYGGKRPFGNHEQMAMALSAADAGTRDAGAMLRAVAGDSAQPAIARATAFAESSFPPNAAALTLIEQGLHDSSALVRLGALQSAAQFPAETRLRLAGELLSGRLMAIRVEAARLLAAVPPQQFGPEQQARFDRAAAEYVQVQRYNADRAEARVNLGTFLAERGDLAGAEAELRSAIHMEPSSTPAYINLADVYRALGRDGDGEALSARVSRGAVDQKTTVCLMPPRPIIWCKSADGTEKNQSCHDEGPLTLERSKTVDEEISAKVVDFLDRNDPKKTGKPFFVWYNPARMHVVTVLSPKYEAMVGVRGGKDWGRERSRHEAARRQHRRRYQEARGHGPARQHHSRFHHRQWRRGDQLPRRRRDSVKGQKGEAWEGGYRAPLVVRWPGHIKPGTVKTELFAALDWVPTLVDIAGGPKGDGLKAKIEAGAYPGIVKTTLDGFDQRDYLEGRSEQCARDYFFYFSGATPSAVRYKNWKMYYTMSQPGPAGWIMPLIPFHFTLVQNIKRDPFEQSVGIDQKSAMSLGRALGAPATAFQYDWNMLPIGQQLWMEHLMSYKKFPPLQAPESYNLDQILDQMKKATDHPGS